MTRNRVAFACVLALTTVGLSLPAAAQRRQNAQVGMLECQMTGGVGMIITSSKGLSCLFRPTRGRPDRYVGTIRKFGLDIGATAGGVIAWAVFAPTSRPSPGALAGSFVGVGADASVVAGGGANALVGGSNRTFTLQPISLQAQAGVNLAVGVADMELLATR
jgi:hypothetical protein